MKKDMIVRGSAVPSEILVGPAVDLVKSTIDAIRECVVQREIQETQREAIRAQAAVAIAQIEADTSKYLIRIRQVHEERMAVIATVQLYLECFGADKDLQEITDLCVKLLSAVKVGQL